MKKLLVFAGLCAALQTSAQYSQWSYGFAGGTSQASNGHVIQANGTGHIMAGPRFSGQTGQVYVIRNTLPGNSLTPPAFNSHYTLYSGQVAQDVKECKITELNDGGYGVAGICNNPSTSDLRLFYMRLDAAGDPVGNIIVYAPTLNPSTLDIFFGNIRSSVQNDVLYIVGGIKQSSTGEFLPYVMKIDYSGTISWSGIYDVSETSDFKAYDIAEDLNGDLGVIGTINRLSSNDGFFFPITSGGTAGTSITLYGTDNTTDELYSIVYSRGTAGWAVCGKSNYNVTTMDAWIMTLDLAGTPVWSNLAQDGPSDISDNVARQIIERRRHDGDYEYFTVGSTAVGPLGSSDVQVFRGYMVSGNVTGQFFYGGTYNEYGYGIDANDVADYGEGLAVFGSTESFAIAGTMHDYFIKAYFNGVSGCNEYFRRAAYVRGPGITGDLVITSYDDMVPAGDIYAVKDVAEEKHLCVSDEVDGGDNSLKVQVKDAGLTTQDKQMVLVSPNPVSATSDIRLNVTAPAGTIEVIVADYMGREYINQHFDIREGGEQTLSVELNKANLTPGLYLLKVNGLDKPATQVLVVK